MGVKYCTPPSRCSIQIRFRAERAGKIKTGEQKDSNFQLTSGAVSGKDRWGNDSRERRWRRGESSSTSQLDAEGQDQVVWLCTVVRADGAGVRQQDDGVGWQWQWGGARKAEEGERMGRGRVGCARRKSGWKIDGESSSREGGGGSERKTGKRRSVHSPTYASRSPLSKESTYAAVGARARSWSLDERRERSMRNGGAHIGVVAKRGSEEKGKEAHLSAAPREEDTMLDARAVKFGVSEGLSPHASRETAGSGGASVGARWRRRRMVPPVRSMREGMKGIDERLKMAAAVRECERERDGDSLFQSLGWKVSVCVADESTSQCLALAYNHDQWMGGGPAIENGKLRRLATYHDEYNGALATAALPTTCIPTPKPWYPNRFFPPSSRAPAGGIRNDGHTTPWTTKNGQT
ncbi:hypothetical protein B0H13DRAFT_1864190 [Mycena leptocephala]|nr:hypothetical protein B0H13DRAFT_1864190 [Mycena leptocephala]